MTSSSSSDSERTDSESEQSRVISELEKSVSRSESQNPPKSNKQVELGFCLEEKGPKAAKRFNDLIAKTLKLQE
jgi:hypothetical protein